MEFERSKMSGRVLLSIVLTIVLIAALVGVGTYVYNAGVAQGLAANGKIVAPDGSAAPYPYYGPVYQPWGFGFGIFGLIFPLLFIFVIFGLLRGLLFGGWRRRGPWGWDRPHSDWEKNVPPTVEEWHRKMHESPSDEKRSI
jgi:hypothetical protein